MMDPKSPPVRIYTARIDYQGPARVDITRKGNSPFGPQWTTLAPVLKIRAEKATLEKTRAVTLPEVDAKNARRIELEAALDAAWERYTELYREEMLVLWRRERRAWEAISDAARQHGHIVLVCYCTNHERCHRSLLASMLVRAFAALRPPLAAALGEPAELGRSEGIACYRGRKSGRRSMAMTLYTQPPEARAEEDDAGKEA